MTSPAQRYSVPGAALGMPREVIRDVVPRRLVGDVDVAGRLDAGVVVQRAQGQRVDIGRLVEAAEQRVPQALQKPR